MIEAIRSLVRPVVTVLFAIAVVYFTATKILTAEFFVAIASAAIVWWYKDRSDKKSNNENKG